MTINIEDHEGIKVLRLHGELTGDEEHALVETIAELIEEDNLRVVVDLAQVTFMNSAGLGDLVRVAAQVNTREGRMMLASLSPFVEGVLRSTNLDRFFEVADTVDKAVERLR